MAGRGVALEMAMLGLLQDARLHGYELRKQVTALLGWGRVLSYGTLYPCLKAMARNGYLQMETPGAVGGRGRIAYTITAAGRERFARLVSEGGPSAYDDELFGVHFAFFARADTPTRVRILEGRRSRLEERLERLRLSALRSSEHRDAYTLELQRYGVESAEREVHWLSRLIDAERAGTAPGRPAQPEPTPTDSKSSTKEES